MTVNQSADITLGVMQHLRWLSLAEINMTSDKKQILNHYNETPAFTLKKHDSDQSHFVHFALFVKPVCSQCQGKTFTTQSPFVHTFSVGY